MHVAHLPEDARGHVAWDRQVHHKRLARGVPRARVWEHVVCVDADKLVAVVVIRAEDLLGTIAVVQVDVNYSYAGTVPLGPGVLGGGSGVVQQTEAQPQLQNTHAYTPTQPSQACSEGLATAILARAVR